MSGAERVLVVGAAGFGRESLDVLDAMVAAGEPVEIVGVLDDGPSEMNLARLADRGVSYLGTIDDWLAGGDLNVRFVLGIGNPGIRRLLVERLVAAGMRPFTAVHPSATFGARTQVGEGAVVCAGVVISNNVRLGRHVHVNPNATIGHDAVLHEFVSINPAAVVSGGAHRLGRWWGRRRRSWEPGGGADADRGRAVVAGRCRRIWLSGRPWTLVSEQKVRGCEV